jgi:hypothetical protein
MNWTETKLSQHTGLATSAVTLGEVTALDHKVLDDTVESRTLITKALLASSQSAEVLSCLGDSLAVEAHNDTAELLVTLLNVEEDLVGDLGALGSLSCLGEEEEAEPKDQGRHEKATKIEHDCCFSDNQRIQRQRKGKVGEEGREGTLIP